MDSPHGRETFSVLLFQDLSVIPVLALVGILGAAAAVTPPRPNPLAGPRWRRWWAWYCLVARCCR